MFFLYHNGDKYIEVFIYLMRDNIKEIMGKSIENSLSLKVTLGGKDPINCFLSLWKHASRVSCGKGDFNGTRESFRD